MVKKGCQYYAIDTCTIRDRERFLECLSEIRLRVLVGYAWRVARMA